MVCGVRLCVITTLSLIAPFRLASQSTSFIEICRAIEEVEQEQDSIWPGTAAQSCNRKIKFVTATCQKPQKEEEPKVTVQKIKFVTENRNADTLCKIKFATQ